ncbi:MAG: thermonuclease family protein [Parvularculaceae bacterium]
MNRRDFVALATIAFGANRAVAGPLSASTGAEFKIGGEEFRLADVLAPAPDEPFAGESSKALNRLFDQGRLDFIDTAERDRWNRRVVAVSVEARSGVMSVQEEMAREGAVRVRPESADHGAISRLLLAEREARAARRGLWGLPYYMVRDAASHRATGAFYLIEGKPLSAAVVKGRAYLNFGDDYRTDVTATASSRNAKRWAKAGLDWKSLDGAVLRIRGYVAAINGPSIEIEHKLQIEPL